MNRFIQERIDDYENTKNTRRQGRPASSKEDQLKIRMDALLREERDGFCAFHHCLSIDGNFAKEPH
jgi:translation machinery-associated protein 16